MDALQNLLTRRSTKKFADKSVERDKLEKILEIALHSPTGMNAQERLYTVLTEKEDIAKLENLMGKALGNEKYNFYGARALVIITVPREHQFGQVDTATAMENIYLAANALELGCCWINQLRGVCDDVHVRNLLNVYGIPESHVNYAVAALGYADYDYPEKARTERVNFI